jgi:hypothetical protein
MSPHSLPPPDQQPDDVRLGISVLLIAGTLGVVLGSVLWARGLLRGESPRPAEVGLHEPGAPVATPSAPIAGVRQTPIDIGGGLTWKRSQEKRLDSWGWENREAGLVRLPIERAMDLVLAGHVPPALPSPSPPPPAAPEASP